MNTPLRLLYLFLLVFSICTRSTPVCAQWQNLGSPETGTVLHYDADGSRIYVCAFAGIFYSDNDAASWTPMNIPVATAYPQQIQADNGRVFLVSRPDEYGLDPASVYRTDDTGLNWKDITPFSEWYNEFQCLAVKADTLVLLYSDSIAISFDKGDSYIKSSLSNFYFNKVFFHNDNLIVVGYGGAYKSSDLGITWEQISAPPSNWYFEDLVLIDNILWKCEVDPDTYTAYISKSTDIGQTWILVGMPLNLFISSPRIVGGDNKLFLYDDFSGYELYASLDDGNTWSLVNGNLSGNRFAYLKGILFAENAVGIRLSKNNGVSFQKSNKGFKAAAVNQFAVSGNNLWASANGAVFKKNTASNDWLLTPYEQIVSTGDGHLLALHNDTLTRSADGGTTWVKVPPTAFGQSFYPFFDLLSAASNVMYVTGYSDGWYSTDYGLTWQKLPIFEEFGLISFSQGKYVGASNLGGAFVSDDGVTWQSITYNIWAPGVWNIRMIHHHNGYVFTYTSGSLGRLAPGATTWEQIEGPVQGNVQFFDTPQTMTMKSYGNLLIAGVYGYGVYVSTDNGDSWQPASFGLEDFQSLSSIIVGQDLLLGVNGGVWKRPLSDFDLNQYTGQVFLDNNANGTQEPDEPGLAGVKVLKQNQQVFTTSEQNGDFILFSDDSNSDFLAAAAPSQYSTVTTIPIPVSGPVSQLKFGVHFIPNIYDASVTLTNLTPFRPGFESDCFITYHNAGTEKADITIKFTMDDVLEYVSSSIMPTVIVADTLSWVIKDVAAGTSGNIVVTVKVSTNVVIGDFVRVRSWVAVDPEQDMFLADNSSELRVAVVGSFDPNDKAVSPSGILTPTMIADTQKLVYTIRFQNTGNYPASFVRIQDTLSPNLRIQSLEVLAASHNFTWRLLPANVIEFFFPNINLPDSTTNEPESHGFVKFSIEAKPNLQLGERVENRAFIYFDYNEPVVTNTVGSTVSLGTHTYEPRNNLVLRAIPVPAQDFLNLQIKGLNDTGQTQVLLLDTKGVAIKTLYFTNPENMQIDMRDLPTGNYFLWVQNGEQTGMVNVVKI